jgi:hypothetical protein
MRLTADQSQLVGIPVFRWDVKAMHSASTIPNAFTFRCESYL